ncbi:ammonia-forming cytochrome c nitrite reductase subunit c552, partial [uncultured Capnocytophaga sp.]|uniref:ammonia-forming cytochrome c nitrite reductase subunit c552 n=1 Tax=uncultured Capnocytophaga sp. TaxID=159273 RepID=UPI00339011C9
LNIKTAFVMPDISTKAKAQKEIGLDIPKEEAAKKEFLKTIVPKWIETAKKEGRLVTQK